MPVNYLPIKPTENGKIIFLDIDGVLNCVSDAANGVDLSNVKVCLLDDICKETGANIVVSSTWRKLYSLDTLQILLYRAGLKIGGVVGVTPNLGKKRGYEIQKVLDDHSWITNYVILDDDSDMLEHQYKHFVRTEGFVGLSKHYKETIISKLNSDPKDLKDNWDRTRIT